ncbi:MAG TPA: hypothetical protein VF856_07650 [Gemmatimonadaceae bacterium]
MRGERGVVLLEVLAALMILGTAALALVELESAGLRATAATHDRELELTDVDRLMVAYTLLNRPELDQRLGDRTVGRYVVNVQRPGRDLYRIAVGSLITVVYKPAASDDKK